MFLYVPLRLIVWTVCLEFRRFSEHVSVCREVPDRLDGLPTAWKDGHSGSICRPNRLLYFLRLQHLN